MDQNKSVLISPYFKYSLNALQRILTLTNTDKLSSSYGCSHRDYWLYKTSDFPDSVRNFSSHSFALASIHNYFSCKEKIFYAEITINQIPETFFNGTELSRSPINFIKYSPISEFPSSTRDFSFSIRKPDKYNEVVNFIDNFNHENLKDSFIFDYFINPKSGEIKVGVRLIFQSTLKTLSDTEIKNAVDFILKPIMELDDVTIPGL